MNSQNDLVYAANAMKQHNMHKNMPTASDLC